MEAIVTSRRVAQEERRRLGLLLFVAGAQKISQALRKMNAAAECLRPSIRNRCQMRIRLGPEFGYERGEGIAEVTILPDAEAVALDGDCAAKQCVVLVEGSEFAAFVRG